MLGQENLALRQPKVSILIPVFNREKYISQTLKSSLDQTYRNIEVIVVDNASTDHSWDIVQRFAEADSRVKVFRNQFNVGPVRNWLRCVEEATGQFGKILWSDDLVAPEFIEKTLPLFNADVGFVFTATNIFSDDNLLDVSTSYLLDNTGLYPSTTYINEAVFGGRMPVSPGCAIFRIDDIKKNLWLQIPNKIQSDFSMHAIGNDLLLFLLTAKDYKYFGHVAEELSFFRAHDDSISVSSQGIKLALYYGVAKAFFIENYFPHLKSKLASLLWLLLLRHKDCRHYGFNLVSDFFYTDVRLNKLFLGKTLIVKSIRYSKRLLHESCFFVFGRKLPEKVNRS